MIECTAAESSPSKTMNQISTKTIRKRKKEIVCEVARGDKHNLRIFADSKAQISKAFIPLTRLICTLISDLRKPSGRNVVFFPSLHPLLDTITLISLIVFFTSRNLTHNLFFFFFFLIPIVSGINPLSAKLSFQLWYPDGQRLKVISLSWSGVKSPSKCFSNTEPTTIIASRVEKPYSAFRQKFPKLWTSVAHSFLQQIAQNKNWAHPKATTLPRICKVEMQQASLLYYSAKPQSGGILGCAQRHCTSEPFDSRRFVEACRA